MKQSGIPARTGHSSSRAIGLAWRTASVGLLLGPLLLSGCFLLSGCLLLSGCTAAGRFPMRDPVWQDPDRLPFGPRPAEYISPMVWDVGDQSIFYPLTRVFAVEPAGEALNVNAFDEVPDSSWFTNRFTPPSLADVALGPCAAAGDPVPTPWTVVGAKPNGANPGFLIEDARGTRHLVKFDGLVQGPRATAADVVVSKLYHAAGYYVPCNRIVYFERSALQIAKGATSENPKGDAEPLTLAHLEAVYAKAQRAPDGRFRASASQFLEGKPLGPFTYQGLRNDDPNDVVPHQDRRELRGMRLLAAWTQHFDAREQNTLAMWIATSKDQGYVRHDILDFGDCFGSVWEPPAMGRRLGHSYYFDLSATLVDWLTLGFVERPWDSARFGPSGKVFGYYQVEQFDPEAWKPGYPNPAFGRMSERDGAWMARIISGFGDAQLHAAVRTGELRDSGLEAELFRVLAGRRDRILDRYLTRLSALTHPEMRRGSQDQLCIKDLAVSSGQSNSAERGYAVTAYPEVGAAQALGGVRPSIGDRVCATLPRQVGAAVQAPRYLVVDWVAQSGKRPAEFPARVHLYDFGASGLRVVGLERPESFAPPAIPPG